MEVSAVARMHVTETLRALRLVIEAARDEDNGDDDKDDDASGADQERAAEQLT